MTLADDAPRLTRDQIERLSTDDLRAYVRLMDEREAAEARTSIHAFYKRMTGFSTPRHLVPVFKVLQAQREGRIGRAMVFMPPRHAKSLTCSQLYPAWRIGADGLKVMGASHTQRLATQFGGRVRNLLRHPKWPWPETRLLGDTSAKDEWGATNGGRYIAFGFGGSPHGNPAELLTTDDPLRNRQEALSDIQRETVWETYRTDLLSRLEPPGDQLMILTRWHEGDPPGKILPEGYDGRTGWYRDRETQELWFVLSMPAVAEHDNDPLGRKPGEWLWPERFGEERLGGFRRRGGWVWASLFQQRPAPEEGLLFQRDHLRFYDPESMTAERLGTLAIYGASDYAVTAEAGAADPDWTVHLILGVDADWNVYLLDGWRGRTTSDRWVQAWIRLVLRWRPVRWWEERGQIISGVGPFLAQRALEERAWCDRQQLTSTTSKEQRAAALLGVAAMGRLWLPRVTDRGPGAFHGLTREIVERELLAFPGGRHDDVVDTLTLFARGLSRMMQGEDRRPKTPRWPTMDDLWSTLEREDGPT